MSVPELPVRTHKWVVASVTLLLGLPYFFYGPGFVLDDWYTLRNAHFEGMWHSADNAQRVARPGAWLVHALLFGGVGEHPALAYAIQLALAVACAVALLFAARRFLSATQAFFLTLLWVVIPHHTSLLHWASAANITVALLLFLLAVPSLSSPRRRYAVLGLFLLAGSGLTYEATLPAGALLVLILGRRHSCQWMIVNWSALALVGGWITLHWHPDKKPQHPDLSDFPAGQLSTGLVEWPVVGAALGTVAITILMVIAWNHLAAGRRGHVHPDDRLLVAAGSIMAAGMAPFVFYFYSSVGAGDRFHVITGIGTALMWMVVLSTALRFNRVAGIVLIGTLVVTAVASGQMRAQYWARAGRDADLILTRLAERYPEPTSRIHVGPCPRVEHGMAPLLDDSNVEKGVQLRTGNREQKVSMFHSAEEFAGVKTNRFDLGSVSQRLVGKCS